MGMKTTCTCDRCGREMKEPTEIEIKALHKERPIFYGEGPVLTRHANSNFSENIYLCNDCRRDFWKFMEGKK